MNKLTVLQCLEADDRSWKNQRYFWDNYGSSYTQQISRMRKQGYDIIDRWTNKVGGTKDYKIVSTPDFKAPVDPEPVIEPEPHHEARNASYDPSQMKLI